MFPERLVVHLAPDHIQAGQQRVACDPQFGPEPWRGAAAALRAVAWPKRARVAAVLSSHFVRYALVPWSDSLADPAEEEACVRHHFVRIHGERARKWALRWSEDGADAPRLASAIDAELPAALKDAFPAQGGARLASIQPALMALANRVRKEVPAAGAWLVAAEEERACVALHSGGRWRAVQTARGPWLPTLEREWHRTETGSPRVAFVAGSRAEAAEGWTFREVPA